jgi:hypothetical protein
LPWQTHKMQAFAPHAHVHRPPSTSFVAMNEPSSIMSRSGTLSHPPAAQLRSALWVLALLVLCGYVDWTTGYEVSVFLLYTVPVGVATRRQGLVAGLLASTAAMATWVWADVQGGHVYSQHWFLYVNALNRLACFVLTVLSVSYLGAKYQRLSDKVQAFTGEIPHCNQCHRFGAPDGYWRSAEQYLADFGGAHLRHKACPDCARRVYARAAYACDESKGDVAVDAAQSPHIC